jgi:hypothetical protein
VFRIESESCNVGCMLLISVDLGMAGVCDERLSLDLEMQDSTTPASPPFNEEGTI